MILTPLLPRKLFWAFALPYTYIDVKSSDNFLVQMLSHYAKGRIGEYY